LTRLVYSARALDDLEQLTRFLAARSRDDARQVALLIAGALEILLEHPQIGRPVRRDLRELVISRGRTGYVALYRYRPASGRIEVLAIRHQLEAGFSE
jgi:plasmid stabilization system protein ParE